MKFYETKSIKIRGNEAGDEFTAYSGADEKEAIKKGLFDWISQSDFDKKHSTEEVRVYDLPDDLDINDDDELTNAICNSCGYDVIASGDYKFGEKLTEEFECSMLEKEDFANKLGVSLEIFEELLQGFVRTNDIKKDFILKKAEEICENEVG